MATDQQIVTGEERLRDLLEDPNLSRLSDRNQSSIPKIQKVQPYLRERTGFQRHYSPKLLSIGPIHHGHEKLQLGEHYKKRWTRAYLEVDAELNEGAAQRLYQKFASEIKDQLKMLYSEDAIKKYEDENKNNDLIWMLFVDACSILHVMNNAGKWDIDAANALEIKIDQLHLLLLDMLLLENQLPFKLLVLLTGDEYKTKQSMLKLLRNHRLAREPNTDNTIISVGPPPAHLLDLLHKIVVRQSTHSSSSRKPQLDLSIPSSPSQKPQPGDQQQRNLIQAHQLCQLLPCFVRKASLAHQELPNSYKIRNIQELKAAGIRLKRSQTTSIEAVNFKTRRYRFWAPGDLEIPEIIVDDFTAPTFMNLIAYEMCPDFHNYFDVSSYVAFLDRLIDHQDDVKELRSAGVLQNHLGNDEEVAKLFNTISTDLINDISKYARVRNQIEEHCDRKGNIWMAEVLSEHFSSPWTVMAFLTAVIITGLTVVQTWFAINPRE